MVARTPRTYSACRCVLHTCASSAPVSGKMGPLSRTRQDAGLSANAARPSQGWCCDAGHVQLPGCSRTGSVCCVVALILHLLALRRIHPSSKKRPGLILLAAASCCMQLFQRQWPDHESSAWAQVHCWVVCCQPGVVVCDELHVQLPGCCHPGSVWCVVALAVVAWSCTAVNGSGAGW